MKPHARQNIAQAKILFALLFAVTVGILGAGCSVHMWRSGWAIHSSTLDAHETKGYRQPVAAKDANGDVVFEYDICLSRYGATGNLNDNEQILGLKRITNIVSRRALQPITNIWPLNAGDIYPNAKKVYPGAGNNDTFVQPGHCLPILRCNMNSDKSLRFPTSECVVWDGEYIWYIPPQHANDMPMAAVLSRETIHTPVYLYPVKAVLFPICFIGDVYYMPVMYFFDR
ncbi:MAG: hypothetical protein ACLQAH_10410 [Limisphaerales bacterium]